MSVLFLLMGTLCCMWCDERKWDFIYLFLLLFFLLICVMVFCRSGVQGFDFVFILFGCFYSNREGQKKNFFFWIKNIKRKKRKELVRNGNRHLIPLK